MGDVQQLSEKQSVKCMIVGDSRTGKTNLFKSLLNHPLPTEYTTTVFDVVTEEMEMDVHSSESLRVNLSLWDSAGSHAFDEIRPISYAHTDCFILCYAIDDRTSLENIENRWIPEITAHGDGPSVPIILVATKYDQIEKSSGPHDCGGFISIDEGHEIKQKVRARALFECTAITKFGTFDILQKAIELACEKKAKEESPPNPVWKFQSLYVSVIGDDKVGKSTLIRSLTDKEHLPCKEPKESMSPERRLQEYYKVFVKDGCEYFLSISEVPVQVGNNAGQLFSNLCNLPDVVILCYAINDPFSFQSVTSHWNSVKNHTKNFRTSTVLVGTKLDLQEASEIIIPTVDGEELMLTMGCAAFIECSAFTSENVSEVLKTIVDLTVHDSDEKLEVQSKS